MSYKTSSLSRSEAQPYRAATSRLQDHPFERCQPQRCTLVRSFLLVDFDGRRRRRRSSTAMALPSEGVNETPGLTGRVDAAPSAQKVSTAGELDAGHSNRLRAFRSLVDVELDSLILVK